MSNTSRKFVAWDWNGTLLDDTQAVLDCVNIVLSNMGKNAIDMELFQSTQIRPLKKFYLAIGLSEDEAPAALENERSIFNSHYEPMADKMALRDGTQDLLRDLRAHGASNIIVSNHISDKIARLLKLHAVDGHFDEVIAYLDYGSQFRIETKGQKLGKYIAAQELSPGNAIIIGDTLEEIEIARDLGMISVAITGGVHSEQRLRELAPDYIVHSMQELRGVMQERGFVA